MSFEFDKMLADARNLARVAGECAIVKLENDMVAGEDKWVLCNDLEMLASLLDAVVEKLNVCLEDVA